jgi:hypothetical protein
MLNVTLIRNESSMSMETPKAPYISSPGKLGNALDRI